jgi:hypothetical protein
MDNVRKSSPEEQQTLAEIMSLVSELQQIGSAGPGMQQGGYDDGGTLQGADPAMKANPDTLPTEAPLEDNDGLEGEDPMKRKEASFMKDPMDPNDPNEENELEAQKSLQTSPHDGAEANDSAELRIEDIPEGDEDDIAEVARGMGASENVIKMLRNGVAKRRAMRNVQKSKDQVIKSLQAEVARNSAIMSEVLAGLAGASGLIQEPVAQQDRAVAKSLVAKTGPIASYGSEPSLESMLEQLVQKAQGAVQPNQQHSNDDFSRGEEVRKNMRGFTELFGNASRGTWGF